MKNLINVSALMLAAFAVACVDVPVENPNPEQETPAATRAEETKGKDYYWSGRRKIYLDPDPTKMIIGFEDEKALAAFTVTNQMA